MRLTKLFSLGFAALAVGVAVPGVSTPNTAATVTNTNDNAANMRPPWDCPTGSYYGYCGWNGRRMIKCCVRGQPPARTEVIDARDLEAAVTTDHGNACAKTCPAGSHCGYCGFSGRYSIECCKKETSIGQLEKTCMRRCTTESCEMHCQNHGSELINHISTRDLVEHVELIGRGYVDNKFCGRCPRDMQCWVHYLNSRYPTYSCKNKSSAELDSSPTALVNRLSTRNELSALDKKIAMDICFLNGATCTDLQDCRYDPMRREQYYCVNRPLAELNSSPVTPVDHASAADINEIRVDDQYCLDLNNVSCYTIGRECWAHVDDNNTHNFFCKAMSSTKVIDTTVPASTNSLITRADRPPNHGEGDCMEHVDNEACLWYGKLWCPSINKQCYAYYRNYQFWIVDCQDQTPPFNTLSTRDNLMPRNCRVSPENCTPRCSKSELCYFNFKTIGEPGYLCDANPTSSFIESVPVVELRPCTVMQTSEEVDPSKCDPRCAKG